MEDQIEFYNFWLKFWNLCVALRLFTSNPISLITFFIKAYVVSRVITLLNNRFSNRNKDVWKDINLGFSFPFHLFVAKHWSTFQEHLVYLLYIKYHQVLDAEIKKTWSLAWPWKLQTSEKKNNHKCEEYNKGKVECNVSLWEHIP